MYSHSLHRLMNRSRIQELNASTGLLVFEGTPSLLPEAQRSLFNYFVLDISAASDEYDIETSVFYATGYIKYEIVEKTALRFRQQGRGTFKNNRHGVCPKASRSDLTPRRLPQSLQNRGQARQMSLYALPQQQR